MFSLGTVIIALLAFSLTAAAILSSDGEGNV